MYDNIEKFLQSHDNDLMPIRYTYLEIKKITNGFKDKWVKGALAQCIRESFVVVVLQQLNYWASQKPMDKILLTKLPQLEEFTMSMSCNL
jgi:hypothetical protein